MTPDLKTIAADPAEFRRHLRIDADGTPRTLADCLDDWQRTDFAALDPGWRRVVGLPVADGTVYQRAYLERPRGHSKTSDLATMVTWALLASRRRVSGVAAAADRDQAGILKDCIAKLVSLNSWLNSFIDVQAYRVTNHHTNSTLEILSSDTASSWGILPDFVVVDEISHWSATAGQDLWHSLLSSAAKRAACMVLVISNAGLGMNSSWQWSVREACRTSDNWYFSRPDGPASWINQDLLDEQRRMLPTKAFARLWLNTWQTDSGDALDGSDIEAAILKRKLPWHQRPGPMEGNEPGFQFVGGLDIGVRKDHSALVVVGSHAQTQRIRLANCLSWTPPVGGEVNLEAVQAAVLEAHQKYRLQAICFDPSQMLLMAQTLRRHHVPMVEVPFVGKNLNAMATTLLDVFRSRRVDLYRDDDLIRDLQRLTIVQRNFGFKLEAAHDQHGHADRGIAFALALLRSVNIAAQGSDRPARLPSGGLVMGSIGLGRPFIPPLPPDIQVVNQPLQQGKGPWSHYHHNRQPRPRF